MATTAIWDVSDNLNRVINYASNPEKTEAEKFDQYDFNGLGNVLSYTLDGVKTEKQCYVSGVNVEVTNAYEEMIATKKQYQKEKGILAFHAYQSFAPDEVTAELAHKIGIELAKQMWGERFEVIVSTHLDKKHFHNHFVINSVSFKNGLRYYDNKKNYKRLRLLSDELCKQYSLSVIENPTKKGWHYAEWQAEKENHPTWRSTIRDDVDMAINNAMTYTQFISNLKKQGYEVKSHVKHMAVKLPSMERFIRLRSLSRDNAYDEEHIKERILQNSIVKMESLQKPIFVKYKYKGDLNKARKLTGFRALYFHYLYHMGILPKNNAPRNRVHALLKEDLRYMDQITKETTLLCRHRINTIDDLDKQERFVQERLDKLTKERRCVYNKIRRCKSTEKKELLQQDIGSLSLEIRELRKEVVLYASIRERSVSMKDKLLIIKNEKEQKKNVELSLNEKRNII